MVNLKSAKVVTYSGTIPIQNIVLSPTSISYLHANVSLPSSPIRNTDRPAGIVVCDFRVYPALLYPIHVHFVLRLDRHIHPRFGRMKVEVPRAKFFASVGRD